MRHPVLRLCTIVLLACAVTIGVSQVLAKKPAPPPSCPTPSMGCVCITLYAPVACQTDDGLNCIYSNQCFAGCAGFSPSDCNGIGPGPVPLPF